MASYTLHSGLGSKLVWHFICLNFLGCSLYFCQIHRISLLVSCPLVGFIYSCEALEIAINSTLDEISRELPDQDGAVCTNTNNMRVVR